MKYQRVTSVPENPYSKLIPDQTTVIVPSFTLESGVVLENVPVAYWSRGTISPEGDNALVICHALSGSADVSDWWGPLLGGPGKAFDVSRFFVICINTLGSPYGSASPVTYRKGDPSLGLYGPEFPLTTIRDDVRLSKMILDDLGIKQVAAAVGGSMGGMEVLEFAYLGKDYVKSIIPIATSARHSAWGISWGEAQRQSIYSDPKYGDGYYSFDDPPTTGLGAARMAALLTYRSRDSFESRFGRNTPNLAKHPNINGASRRPSTPNNEHFVTTNEHFDIHNEGNKNAGSPRLSLRTNGSGVNLGSFKSISNGLPTDPQLQSEVNSAIGHACSGAPSSPTTGASAVPGKRLTTYFSAQSYLRYQGDKFIKRFDANCYIAITRKLDTHDVSVHCEDLSSENPLHCALAMIKQPTLVLGIRSDGLFTYAEQEEIARNIPGARLETIDSPEGHDAFLLQFEQVNEYISSFFAQAIPNIVERAPLTDGAPQKEDKWDGKITKNSTFGEAEVDDITAW